MLRAEIAAIERTASNGRSAGQVAALSSTPSHRIAPSVRHRKPDRCLTLADASVLASVTLALVYLYVLQVDLPNLDARLNLHQQILDGTAPAPYRYRMLPAFLTECLASFLSLWLSYRASVLVAYVVWDTLSLSVLVRGLHLYLRTFFPRRDAMIAVLFAAVTMPLAFRNHQYQPWSLLEPGLLSFALWGVAHRDLRIPVAAVVLASLNRETGLFVAMWSVVAAFAPPATHAPRWWPVRNTCTVASLLGALSLLTVTVVWIVRGVAPGVITVSEVLSANLEPRALLRSAVQVSLFFGAFWVLACFGFRSAPVLIRRTAMLTPLYLAVIAIGGLWWEVRLLMTLYPVVLPLALSGWARSEGCNSEAAPR